MAVSWNALYSYAHSLVGTPYLYGGTGQGGFDCSGFTEAVYAKQGLQIGRTTVDQLQSGQAVGQDGNWQTDIAQLQPGDLIFYGQAGASGPNAHVVMYVGNNQVIQAGGKNVNVTSLFQSASPNEPFLGVRRYTQLSGAPPGGASGAAGIGPPGNTSAPSAPSMSDIPALDAYIKQNYAQDAWLLAEPEVRSLLESSVAQGLTADQIQAKLQQTGWWKKTSQAQIAFDQLRNQTPDELNFNDPGSKVNAVLANVTNIGSTIGIPVNTVVGRTVALEAMRYGWSNQQIQAKLGSLVSVTPSGPGANAGVTSNDPHMLAQLEQAAGQYLYNPSQATLNTYARGIASGTMTMDTFNAFLANQAATKYPSLAEQIKGGMTPAQIIDPLRTEAANTMEVSPDSINFIADPTYAKILNYRPPAVNGAQQAPRVMTTSEMDTYLRGTGAYSYTQNARNSASDLTDAIVKTFGKVAS
jgi:cell wall-associated NlpC family hydrolase